MDVALAVVAVGAAYLKRSEVYLLTLYCVYLMATLGLNLTVGYAGQMSLGHAAFFGIGAYHAAILLKFGWPFFVVLPAAAIASLETPPPSWASSPRHCAKPPSPWCSTVRSRRPDSPRIC